MERLLTLKGSTGFPIAISFCFFFLSYIFFHLSGNEAVLFLRLHLLQGIVAFHQGKTLESIKLLNQVKEEIQKLTINDGDLTQLIGLGNSNFKRRPLTDVSNIFIFFYHFV